MQGGLNENKVHCIALQFLQESNFMKWSLSRVCITCVGNTSKLASATPLKLCHFKQKTKYFVQSNTISNTWIQALLSTVNDLCGILLIGIEIYLC